MLIEVMFTNGTTLHNYKIKDARKEGEWLIIVEETEAITHINLNNVNMYSIYIEGPENDNE